MKYITGLLLLAFANFCRSKLATLQNTNNREHQ
jgi:hypothetical protein